MRMTPLHHSTLNLRPLIFHVLLSCTPQLTATSRCKFDSNSTQNTSPALRVLCLVVSVMQSFETTSVHLNSNTNKQKNLTFSKVSTMLEIFNVFLERYS